MTTETKNKETCLFDLLCDRLEEISLEADILEKEINDLREDCEEYIKEIKNATLRLCL